MAHIGTFESRAGEELSLKTHISYGASQLGLNCMGTAFGINLLFFYTTILKFDTALFGIIMLIGQVLGAILSPVMGYVSDNTPWKGGRRRPYFLLGGIPTAVAFFLIFSPPLFKSPTAISVYLLITTLVFFTARTVFETPCLALAPELTLDYDERTKLSGYRQLLGTLGDAQGAILPLVLFSVFSENRRPAHFVYGLIGCVAMIAISTLTHWGTFEKANSTCRATVRIKESFWAVAKNQPYLIFLLSSALISISITIVTSLVLFLTKYWFLKESLASTFFAAFFVGAICSVPLWVKLSAGLGKKWTFILNMTAYGLLLCSIFIVPRTAYSVITAFMGISGVFSVGAMILMGTISADIIEWDECRTGVRREGAYSGVWSFVCKASIALASMFVGLALKFIHFNADLPAQTASTLFGLKLVFGPVSALLFFVASLAFLAYPITKRKHEEIRRLIGERNEAFAMSK